MQASTLVGVRVHCRVAPSRVHRVILDAIDLLWQNHPATMHLGSEVLWENLIPIVRPRRASADEDRVPREVLGLWSARLCG
jgi:hypothetical protein